jgi:hypothetical protein
VGGFGSLVVADEPRTSFLQKFFNSIQCVHICHTALTETDICIGTLTRPKPSTITPSSSTLQGGKSAAATPPTILRRPTRISNAGSFVTSDLPIARSMKVPSYSRARPSPPPPRPPRSVLHPVYTSRIIRQRLPRPLARLPSFARISQSSSGAYLPPSPKSQSTALPLLPPRPRTSACRQSSSLPPSFQSETSAAIECLVPFPRFFSSDPSALVAGPKAAALPVVDANSSCR